MAVRLSGRMWWCNNCAVPAHLYLFTKEPIMYWLWYNRIKVTIKIRLQLGFHMSIFSKIITSTLGEAYHWHYTPIISFFKLQCLHFRLCFIPLTCS